jgi:hypothetical protein
MNNEEKYNKIFNCLDIKTAQFGSLLIDTRPSAGRIQNIKCLRKNQTWTTSNVVKLYDEIRKCSDKNSINLSMSCLWLTGFTPLILGLSQPKRCSRDVINYLDGMSLATTDQCIVNRSINRLNCIFSSMKWYNTNNKIINESCMDSSELLYNNGLISKYWDKNPVDVRYIVNIDPNKNDGNYFFLIGGSSDILDDNIVKTIPESLTTLYHRIKKDSNNKTDEKTLWIESNDVLDSIWSMNSKKILRTIHGVILIHDHLNYVLNDMGIDYINEIIGYDVNEGIPIKKLIKTSDVISKYDIIYKYCINLCYIYTDILNSKL